MFLYLIYFSICKGSSDDMTSNNGDCNGTLSEMNSGRPSGAAQRNNTTVHVCWHRNTSIGMADQLRATEVCIIHYYLLYFGPKRTHRIMLY